MKIIKVLGIACTGQSAAGDLWLKSYKDTPDGRGDAEFTRKKSEALGFKDFGEAFEFWRQQSKTVPMRPDGKPNRPLTAYHASFEDPTR